MSINAAGAANHVESNFSDNVTSEELKVTSLGHGRWCIPYRYLTAILAFGGFFMAQATRVSFNISLVAMVNYTAEDVVNGSSSECPRHGLANSSIQPDMQGPFDWNGKVQSNLLSSFFYGYVITQLPGGYLAEKVGSTWIFGLAVLVPGLLTLLHPLLAQWDYRAIFATRVVMGLFQGPLYPSNQALWGRWAPPLERSRLITISISGGVCGIMTSMMLSGYLCSLPYKGGWPLPFYLWGVASVVWFVVWRIFSADTPCQSKLISAVELQFIEEATEALDRKPYVQPPWSKILRTREYWALAIYLVTDGLSYYVIWSGVAVYMKQVLHFDISQEGQLAAMPYLACFIVALSSGHIADYIIAKKWLSVTGVRKLFTFIGQGGTAVALIGMGLAECRHILVVSLLIIGYGLNGLTAAGVACVTLDMAPRFAGTLLGMTNFIDDLGGFISPIIVGAITDDQGDKYSWQLVFYLTGGCYLFGIIVFLLLGSAKEQSWAIVDTDVAAKDRSSCDLEPTESDRQPLI